jgi:hypothetical protein
MRDDVAELARFMRGDMDSAGFPHREHVRMGFEMLRRHNFSETAHHYSLALRTMAARAGRPDAFHQTITIAFLSLIAERMLGIDVADFIAFERANADLMAKSALAHWYRPERLTLPDGAE